MNVKPVLPKCGNKKCNKRVSDWTKTFCGIACFRKAGAWFQNDRYTPKKK